MSKKKNNNNYVKKEKETEKNKERVYRNPANSKVGKVIIVTLCLLMALSGLIALIYRIATL